MKKTASDDTQKNELYTGFCQDLDKVRSELRAELESHLDPDKGGDLLDEEFLKKILIKFDDRLEKLCDQFSDKANIICASAASKEIVDIGSHAQKSQSFKSLIQQSLMLYFALSTTCIDPAPTPPILPFSFLGTLIFGVTKLLKGKRRKREEIVKMTMEGFDNNVRPKCLSWAKEILDLLNK